MNDLPVHPRSPSPSDEPFPVNAPLSEDAALLAHSAPPFPVPSAIKQVLAARVHAASMPPFGRPARLPDAPRP